MTNVFSELSEPLAITMWDFSWIERRWPGAGYEDWDLALDELLERGYNAVRIDACRRTTLANESGWQPLSEHCFRLLLQRKSLYKNIREYIFALCKYFAAYSMEIGGIYVPG